MKHCRKVFRACAFLCLLLCCIVGTGKLFMPRWLAWNNYYTVNGFYEEPENTLETVFLGTSVVVNGIAPTQLYQDYGICAYNLATEQQPALAIYYWLEEAYRLHGDSLTTVVMDVSFLRNEEASDAYYHKALDDMRWSGVKLRAIADYADGDWEKAMSFLLPLYKYHSRWDEISLKDIRSPLPDPVNGTRGYNVVLTSAESADDFSWQSQPNWTYYENDNPGKLKEESLHYFERIWSFCKEKDLDLILIKYPTIYWYSGYSISVEQLAEEYGLEFLDLHYGSYRDEVGYIHTLDTCDENHLNYFGAAKFTDLIGRYLVDNCRVTDVRGNPDYAHMEEQLQLYNEDFIIPAQLATVPDITAYLACVFENDLTACVLYDGQPLDALTTKQEEKLREMGMGGLVSAEGKPYLAYIEQGLLEFETKQDEREYKGYLPDTKSLILSNAQEQQGYTVSCLIDNVESAPQQPGISIIVYDPANSSILDTASFDIQKESLRSVYGVQTVETFYADPEILIDGNNRIYAQLSWMALKEQIDERNAAYLPGQMFEFLDRYIGNNQVTICFAVKDEATMSLTKDARACLDEYGLGGLAQLGYREAYVGLMRGGEVIAEMTASAQETAEESFENITVKSAGYEAGAYAQIIINDIDYALNKRGVNIVVYDHTRNMVVDTIRFDTHKEALHVPE